VQGPDDSADVRVAKAIAEAGGFAIEHDRFEAKPELSRGDFPERLQSGYNYIDGFNPSGLFNGWSLSADERSQVPRPERLRLYGMAGEMYRRNLALPNRLCTLLEFLTVQADKADCSAFTAAFSKRSVYDSVGDKIVEALQLRERRLTPEQTELCYPHFRLAANSGWQMTVQNERAHALIPYGEPVLSYPSGKVQMKFRDLARFEAALIEYADPVLAAVTSNYGHAFDRPPGWRARLRARTLHLVPIRMRPVIQRQRARFRRPASLPFYLQAEYLSVVFPDGFPLMSPYVDISAIKDPLMLSRALSLELLLSGKLSV
jgi:asparagine synthase (glutamine-hydrolysing)